jgi:hypothetical protein
MAEAAGVIWIEPPEKMVRALEQYGKRVLVAVHAVAEFIATKMQNEARRNAPWQDRTGNARSGLFGAVEREAAEAIVEIYLSHGHTIYYGQFLELAHGQRYAIIMPTIEQNLPELKRLLDELFR